ncbi:serine--tRNA ligase [Falsihalocynthiibacter sp. SS001]|uniref:serine--tRNA ligase n=1 Tax=Falsihalocynthiibacter sp. SS001 TaxID=3349698 RepID=UPI0036D30180
MHDIRQIRENPAAFDAAMARRGLSSLSEEILAIDTARREKIAAAEDALAARNKASKEVGAAKGRGDEAEFDRLRALVAEKKAEIATLEEEAKAEDARLRDLLMGLPNVIYDDVPEGADENDNEEIRKWGTPRAFTFKPLEHFELTGTAGSLDFDTAAKISGARFVMMKGAVARVHRALAQFMIDTHVDENELAEVNPPVLVRDDAMTGTDKLPKFGDDSYQTTNGWWLVPTAEVPLTYSVAEQTVAEAELPRRMVAHTLCFRSEAGSAGRDTSGMLRQHQFEKVEMVSIVHPDESDAELERMTKCAEGILEKLGLPYRTVKLCTGDIGFGAKRTYDIEVWLPGQDTYREISSCSTTGDFQARRMNARFKPTEGGKPSFVHTLNGSGLAVGRTLIAVLENGQEEDGSVTLPAALHGYLGGKTRITAEGKLA